MEELLQVFGVSVDAEHAPRALLRFPGPCGIRDFLNGELKFLATPEDRVVYFTSRNFEYIEEGAALFGSLVVFDALKFEIVQTAASHIYVGKNLPLSAEHRIDWVPPSVMKRVENWSEIDGPDALAKLIGPGSDERDTVRKMAGDYFAEINAVAQLERRPGKFWFALSAAERTRELQRLGVAPRWSA